MADSALLSPSFPSFSPSSFLSFRNGCKTPPFLLPCFRFPLPAVNGFHLAVRRRCGKQFEEADIDHGRSRSLSLNSRIWSSNKAHAAISSDDGINWWEKDAGPNMIDINSKEELTETILAAGKKLVVVEFFATWCGSCRALYPKLCKLAAEHDDMMVLKINFDENKPLCKSMNIRVLPYFHFYRGLGEPLETFSCSMTKLQKLKDAIATYSIDSFKDEKDASTGNGLADLTETAGSTK